MFIFYMSELEKDERIERLPNIDSDSNFGEKNIV